MSGGNCRGGGQLSYLALGFATIDPSVIIWGSIFGESIVGRSIVALPYGTLLELELLELKLNLHSNTIRIK